MFWIKIISSILILGVLSKIEAYDDFEDLEDMDDDYFDYYKGYDNGQTTATSKDDEYANNRVRRYQEKKMIKTLSPKEIREVRGALHQLLSGIGVENPFTPCTTLSDDYSNFDEFTSIIPYSYITHEKFLTTLNESRVITLDKPSIYFTKLSTKSYKRKRIEKKNINYKKITPSRTPKNLKKVSKQKHKSTPMDEELDYIEDYLPAAGDSVPFFRKVLRTGTTTTTTTTIRTPTTQPKTTTQYKITTQPKTTTQSKTTTQPKTTTSAKTTTPAESTTSTKPSISDGENNSSTEESSSTITTTGKKTKSTKHPELDIPRLLDIIAGLASEFETNLTRKLNETLLNMSIPTCSTPTTEPPVTSEYDSNYTGATIAKCFVCGLDVPGIPVEAHCADAFAGDFLPLVPVDPTAKGKISRFRKYCKYSNVPGYKLNRTHPRNIYGRWTGGCAVRWIDLSGVYTQRTCRNRLQPTMGKHYASKRMAKLERSLWSIENGCIISPMATLVPLSRAVSLYARFHACVCTGSWCNTAFTNTQWMWNVAILLFSIGIT